MTSVMLFLLSLCHLWQQISAQMIFESTAPTTAIVNRQCQCILGIICPPGTDGGVNIRIVNRGISCPAGYILCCTSNGGGGGGGGGGINDPSCGIRKIAPSTDPVGQAVYGAYPWMVALLTKNNNGYVGGGVLISATHVLTVAHKVANYSTSNNLKVRLGSLKLEGNAQATTEPNPYVEISVSKVTLHEQYNPQSLQNDIAILKLSSAAPIATSPNINTACLPSAATAAGTRCWVSGWGKDAFGNSGMYPRSLKEVDVPVISPADCQTALRKKTRLGDFFVLSSSFMCAGGEVGKDACTGDGGSPLVCSTNNGPYQVVGLVTWGIGCANAEVPGVYTDVFNFRSWIIQQAT
ncbi:trypsin-3-like [Pogonomyrmex barbatus]|uniref:Trypsin-3-like n=1 Tax=Pogonomyrmex barbatus TaxID=144034 RepID=A0A6I9W968_9HYME|nr:trypsin-3-like [Pogonomyrmex barbatus]